MLCSVVWLYMMCEVLVIEMNGAVFNPHYSELVRETERERKGERETEREKEKERKRHDMS